MDTGLKTLCDEDLVKEFKEGEEKAFDELYERYASRLKRLIYYYLGDSEEASDVFHDVFLRVFMHIDTFKTDMSFSSWIYRIAVNCSKNYRKKNRRDIMYLESEQMDTDYAVNNVSPEEIILNNEDMNSFYEAVNSLKEKFRLVFLLRFEQGLQYSEISSILKCPERTAKWRMQRAIEKIIDHLKDRDVV